MGTLISAERAIRDATLKINLYRLHLPSIRILFPQYFMILHSSKIKINIFNNIFQINCISELHPSAALHKIKLPSTSSKDNSIYYCSMKNEKRKLYEI